MITKLTSWLIGRVNFNMIKDVVSGLMHSSMSGAEKRAAAIKRIKVLEIDVATFLINLAVEVSVMYLKEKKLAL